MLSLEALFSAINHSITLYLVFPGIVLLGTYLSWRLRFLQLTKIKLGFKTLFGKNATEEGSISHYQAVASVLASNFGTGNISGMAVALTVGGPGALIWMWIMVLLGSSIQFANCLLGVKYRRKNSRGEYIGGPMYYLKEGLGLKKVATFFAVAVIVAAFCAGNFVQVNSITYPLQSMGISPWISGSVIAFLVGLVVIGGAKRITNACSAVVPVMAILYFGAALFILGCFSSTVLPAIALMFKSAFSASSFFGAAAGYSLMRALTTGFDRAIFATDVGTGTVPLLQSSAKTSHPAVDGIVSIVAPIVVLIVCTATALVLMVSGAWESSGLQSTNMVTYAFNQGLPGQLGTYVVLAALFLFGYTTTIAWAACLQRAVNFLFGSRWIFPFHLLYIVLVPLGALLRVDFAWILADVALTSMLVLNLVGVAGLSKEVIGDAREFVLLPKQEQSV